MSHFAKINAEDIVEQVIVAEQDFIDSGAVGTPSDWVQTSYSGSFRKQFAAVGYKYDKDKDVFISKQPFPSWTLDENNNWHPPVSEPVDDKVYAWDEENTNWKEIV